MATFGYMRVSTIDKQEFTRQEFVLKEYKIDKIFAEKISGTKEACGREQFEKMIEQLQAGDIIYFESMSRMARSVQDLINTTNFIVKDKKCKVVFIKENLSIGGDSATDAMSTLVFNIMGAFAQFERDLISDRTKQALQAKKQNGVKLGRPNTYPEEVVSKVIQMKKAGCKGGDITEATGMSAAQISKIYKKYREVQQSEFYL